MRAAAPWFGLAALLGGLACTAVTAGVLVLSDGKETTSWPTETTPVSPAVMLAILTAAANALLLIAFRDGCTIAWWSKMLKGGTVDDCHTYWAYNSGLLQAARSRRFLNRVALSCLATSLIIIDGPLLQRASTVTTRSTSDLVSFSAFISPDPFPRNFSGFYLTHASGAVNMLTPNFGQVAKSFTARSAMYLNYSQCAGICTGVLVGPGFDISCTADLLPYNFSGAIGETFEVGSTTISFDGEFSSGQIEVKSVYKPFPDTVGNLTMRQCNLQIAKVNYPVEISNGIVTLTPRLPTDNDTIEVQYPPVEAVGRGAWPSSIGGIAYVAQFLYTSNVSLYYTGDEYAVTATGPMASTYLNSSSETYGQADMTWADPTPDIISGIRELTFRAAISNSNSSYYQQVSGTEVRARAYYLSHYNYLAAALALMVVSAFTVASLFIGWWHLGRVVSLSPVETAKAFGAPLFRSGDSNADVDRLLKTFGSRSIQYGEVSFHLGGVPEKRSQNVLVDISRGKVFEESRLRLGIAEAHCVSPPVKGVIYTE